MLQYLNPFSLLLPNFISIECNWPKIDSLLGHTISGKHYEFHPSLFSIMYQIPSFPKIFEFTHTSNINNYDSFSLTKSKIYDDLTYSEKSGNGKSLKFFNFSVVSSYLANSS